MFCKSEFELVLLKKMELKFDLTLKTKFCDVLQAELELVLLKKMET